MKKVDSAMVLKDSEVFLLDMTPQQTAKHSAGTDNKVTSCASSPLTLEPTLDGTGIEHADGSEKSQGKQRALHKA